MSDSASEESHAEMEQSDSEEEADDKSRGGDAKRDRMNRTKSGYGIRKEKPRHQAKTVGVAHVEEQAPGINRRMFVGGRRASTRARQRQARKERRKRAEAEAEAENQPAMDADVCALPPPEEDEEPELTWWERRRLRVTVAGVLGLVAIAAITGAAVATRDDDVAAEVPAPSLRASTVAPTAAPRDPAVQDHLGKLLAPVTPGGWDELRNASSAYHRAWLWLAYEDQLPTSTATYWTKYWTNLHQRYALMAVHFFDRTAAAAAKSGVHECEWPGVDCQDHKEWDREFALGRADGIQINLPARMVYRLTLSEQDVIGGEVSPAISLLYYLQDLDAVGLDLSGTLPPSLYELASLKSLVLEGNALTNIDAIGGFQYLEFLSLANNNFQGPLPGSIKDLTMLRTLDLIGNQFTGTVSDILRGLTSLEGLYFDNNKFDSKILTELCMSDNLSNLSLSNNALYGTLPTEFGQCTNLVHLDLTNNDLSGPLPSELGNLAHLRNLELASNSLDSIPSTLNNLTALVNFDISENGVEGLIPDSLLMLTQLIRLDLSDNFFTGTIPSAFANMTFLDSLKMQENDLDGSMPEAVCKLRNNHLKILIADCQDKKDDTDGNIECKTPECCTSCYSEELA